MSLNFTQKNYDDAVMELLITISANQIAMAEMIMMLNTKTDDGFSQVYDDFSKKQSRSLKMVREALFLKYGSVDPDDIINGE